MNCNVNPVCEEDTHLKVNFTKVNTNQLNQIQKFEHQLPKSFEIGENDFLSFAAQIASGMVRMCKAVIHIQLS